MALGLIVLVKVLVLCVSNGLIKKPANQVPFNQPAPFVFPQPDRFQLPNNPLGGAPELAPELQQLFQQMGQALRDRDQERVTNFFDVDRMLVAIAAQDVFPQRGFPGDRPALVQAFRKALGQGMTKNAPLFQWDTSEVRNVKQLDENEAVVIVQHRSNAGLILKMRWWVIRRQAAWKIYDMEDMEMGTRTTTTLAVLFRDGIGANAQETRDIVRAMELLREARRAIIEQQDLDTADRKLKEIGNVKLPRILEALRFIVVGSVFLHRLQPKEALEAFDRANQFNPDMPGLDLLRGLAFNQLRQWDKAHKHLAAYRELLGDDHQVCLELGYALAGMNRFPEACACYRKALDFEPNDLDAFTALLRGLGEGEPRDDIEARFAKLDVPRENFDFLADDCKDRQDAVGLEQLCRAVKKVDPQYAEADYYLALAKVWTGQTDQAMAHYQTAMTRQKDPGKRDVYFTEFLTAMGRAGKAEEAYASATDSQKAFRILAAELKTRHRSLELKKLIALHADPHPNDPLLFFFQGELHVQERKFSLAEKSFAKGMAQSPEAITVAQFRSSRVLARYHTCQAISAYAEIGPAAETFQQLANLCFYDDKFSQLQALLDVHAKTHPHDPDLVRFQFRLKIKEKQFAEAIVLFRAAWKKQHNEAERVDLEDDFLQEMADAGEALQGYNAAQDEKNAFQTLASRLQDDDHWDDLRRLLDIHRKRHPKDVQVNLYQAHLHLEAKEWDQAARVLEEGLKEAPENERFGFRYQYVHAMYKAGRGMEAYQKAESRKEVFSRLANLLSTDRKGAELDALVAAHRPHAADDPDLFYFEGRARVFLKEPAQAIPLYLKAYQLQTIEYRRRTYLNCLVLDLAEQGDGLEGYRAAPDKALAFEMLARALLNQKKDKELALLLQEHGQGGIDHWYYLYRGEWHLLRNEAAEADLVFTAALAKVPRQNQWSIRNGLLRARIKSAKTVPTYHEMGPTSFLELANQCQREKNAPQLEALIAAHRKAHPDAEDILIWEVEVKRLNQDYEGVLRLLTEHREALLDQAEFRGKVDDYRVRTLVKLKRTEEALREAEKVDARWNGKLLLLAHAAQGNVAETIAAMAKQPSRSYFLEACYEDEDLGPILRSDPFRAFRERYPEPEKKAER